MNVVNVINSRDNKYLVDLHVHTSRYSPCAELLDPEMLDECMRLKGLHGVVITEHDIMWEREEIDELNLQLKGRKLYRGVELSCREGHFVVIGLDEIDNIELYCPVADVVVETQRYGGVIIFAHHHLKCCGNHEPVDPQSLPEGIDAIEVCSTMTSGVHLQDALHFAGIRGWQPVAGSDAHCCEHVGAAATSFATLPANEKELARAIKMGMGRYG